MHKQYGNMLKRGSKYKLVNNQLFALKRIRVKNLAKVKKNIKLIQNGVVGQTINEKHLLTEVCLQSSGILGDSNKKFFGDLVPDKSFIKTRVENHNRSVQINKINTKLDNRNKYSLIAQATGSLSSKNEQLGRAFKQTNIRIDSHLLRAYDNRIRLNPRLRLEENIFKNQRGRLPNED